MSDFSNKAVLLPLNQILENLSCNIECSHSLSLTGVTILKEGKYKSRHNVIKEAYQQYKQPYITKKAYKMKYPNEFITKPKRKQRISDVVMEKKVRIKKQIFTVDKKQVTHRIRQFVNQMSGTKKLFFWSISFPLGTTDDAAHILWNKWLTRLRRESMLKDYLWVTERQKNKTIHFHLCINHFMNVKIANRYMRAAIMTSIDQKQIEWTREQAKNYNGVDIAKNRKTKRITNFAKQKNEKSLTNYITKYITKNDEGFKHLAWHSSRGYSNLIIAIRLSPDEYILCNLEDFIDRTKQLNSQYFTFIRWKTKPPSELLKYFAELNNFIQNLIAI